MPAVSSPDLHECGRLQKGTRPSDISPGLIEEFLSNVHASEDRWSHGGITHPTIPWRLTDVPPSSAIRFDRAMPRGLASVASLNIGVHLAQPLRQHAEKVKGKLGSLFG